MNEATRKELWTNWLAALDGAVSEFGDRPFSLRELVQSTCDALGCKSPCAEHYPAEPLYRRMGNEIVEVGAAH